MLAALKSSRFQPDNLRCTDNREKMNKLILLALLVVFIGM